MRYNNLHELEAEFEKDASNIAAFMVEPIQGEAGGKNESVLDSRPSSHKGPSLHNI